MLKLPKSLTVQFHGAVVGVLSMTPDNSRCVFEYDRNWLAGGFSISPLELPLKNGLQVARTDKFYGNFGIFEDSMPDGYGNYLLDRMLRKFGLSLSEMTPVERLSLVGTKGMGALCYVPGTAIGGREDSVTLDEIQQGALDVLSEKDFAKTETLYVNSGNSGGCRPKCLWNDEDGRWLVKFRHTYDSPDVGKEEYDILQLAKKCGITVPDAKLFNGKYLGIRRFDLSPTGEKLHVATASGLLCESIRLPMMDYMRLIKFTQYLTGDMFQVREMFRRMVFNYEIGNNDDHAKNFSFIFSDGKWMCSPAYDITRCPKANKGFHASLVNGKETPDINDFVVVGAEAGLTKGQVVGIVQNIRETVEKYRECKRDRPVAKHDIPIQELGQFQLYEYEQR